MGTVKGSPLLGVKFIGFLACLVAIIVCAIFGILNEWSAGAIVAIFATLAGSNAVISRGYARAEGMAAQAARPPK